MKSYPATFPTIDNRPGYCPIVEHRIETGNTEPTKEPMRRYSLWQQKEIAVKVSDLLRMGVISACESNWAANVILFKKKGYAYQMIVDSCPLIRVTVKDTYPMGNTQNMLNALYGSEWFTAFDVFSGNHHIPIAQKHRHKTAFSTPSSPGFPGELSHFSRMCFGLTHALATFCRLVEQIVGDIIQEFCLLYVDDYFVYSRSFDQRLKHKEEILKRLSKSGLQIQSKKCSFEKPSARFSGHEVSKQGIASDRKKLASILNYPVPHNQNTSRGWLGTVSNFKKFTLAYAKLTDVLNQLLEKDVAWERGYAHQWVFTIRRAKAPSN